MMSLFFYLQHTPDKLFNNCIKLDVRYYMMLDMLFLEYERIGGISSTPLLRPEKATFKKPSFIRVNNSETVKAVTLAFCRIQ